MPSKLLLAAGRFANQVLRVGRTELVSSYPMSTERQQQLEATLAGLEAQRALLGDSVVDAAITPLRATPTRLGEQLPNCWPHNRRRRGRYLRPCFAALGLHCTASCSSMPHMNPAVRLITSTPSASARPTLALRIR